ncbi:uncharacterized protein LOC141714020 [Apium graveolens]|uniref:uncharacterized protein LOC141714020 n=1 Tax=Apium graveolens TaxID=4045 RepID=UPI003D7B02B5
MWNTIISNLRSRSKIVLPVATASIAALLMPNGRTTHSRFHIPIDVTTESTCEIRHGSQLAKLLLKTSLIIWDEAPMANKFCFEALDMTLRDILRTRFDNSVDKPFGGLTVVCGGDFRQILPGIPKGTRADIIDASLTSSHLWPFFKVYELNQNMRLHNDSLSKADADNIATFDKCDPVYLTERAILTPKNEMVHELNAMIMDMIPGESRTYLSSDSICKARLVIINADDEMEDKTFVKNIIYREVFENIIPTNSTTQSDSFLGIPAESDDYMQTTSGP